MIQEATKFVNDLTDYQLNSILLQSAISKLPGMHDYPEKSIKIDDNSYIRFHEIPDFPYGCPPDAVIRRFQERLNANGILATVRASRGEDIMAACGMLAGKFKEDR